MHTLYVLLHKKYTLLLYELWKHMCNLTLTVFSLIICYCNALKSTANVLFSCIVPPTEDRILLNCESNQGRITRIVPFVVSPWLECENKYTHIGTHPTYMDLVCGVPPLPSCYPFS